MTPFPVKNITARMYAVQAEIVLKAAEKADKTISEYARDVLVRAAAKELGVPIPELPELKRGRHAEVIERAAKMNGLSPEEFMRQAAERTAVAMLGFHSLDVTPPPTTTPTRRTPAPRKRRAG